MNRALTISLCLVLAAAFAAADEPVTPKPAVAPAAAAPAADSRPPGEQLYRRHCLTCHQADGWGVPNMQPPIVGGTWVKGDAKALALFVMTGGFGSAERKDSAVSNVMPPFRQLSDEDLAGILTYIRAKFGEGASAVSAADVAAARASGEQAGSI
jgi:mono/diheme cytochrome c family protein